MAGFKKRTISPERVAAVEVATENVPLSGDPRLTTAQAAPFPAALAASSALVDAPGSAKAPEHGNLGSSQVYAVGHVYDVPLKRIRSNPLNPRAIYTAVSIDSMASSLQANGQRVSATGYLDEEGDIVLIEGETRLRGATAAGLGTLRVEVKAKPATDQALYEEARAANVERREQTPLDDAIRWKELLSKGVYPTQAALGQALGLKEDHVSRVISLAVLPRSVTDILAEFPELLTVKMLNALREYWEIAGDEGTRSLIFEISNTGIGYREVVARRKALGKAPSRRPRSRREVVEFRGTKAEIKAFEEDGRIEFALKGLSPEATREVSEMLRTFLVSNANP